MDECDCRRFIIREAEQSLEMRSEVGSAPEVIRTEDGEVDRSCAREVRFEPQYRLR